MGKPFVSDQDRGLMPEPGCTLSTAGCAIALHSTLGAMSSSQSLQLDRRFAFNAPHRVHLLYIARVKIFVKMKGTIKTAPITSMVIRISPRLFIKDSTRAPSLQSPRITSGAHSGPQPGDRRLKAPSSPRALYRAPHFESEGSGTTQARHKTCAAQ